MSIEVRLQGEMGKKFGRTWNVNARNPSHALRIINANVGGALLTWIRDKSTRFASYRVVCELEDGTKRTLSESEYESLQGNVKRIRFTPIIQGASGALKLVIGVVLVVAGFMTSNPALIVNGAMMIFGGISQLLAPKAKKNGEKLNSHYFNGTESTQEQGSPLQLIYGRALVSGMPISVSMTVDQLIDVSRTPIPSFFDR